MGVETERKFLVNGNAWRAAARDSRALRQGYLAIDAGTIVRVRTDGQEARIAIKGPPEGLTRPEFEYKVPAADAEALIGLCRGRVVEKTRYRVPVGEHVWEVDEFAGQNRGLITAELELTDSGQDFPRPDWLGREVSADPRYYNARLSLEPYGLWAREDRAHG